MIVVNYCHIKYVGSWLGSCLLFCEYVKSFRLDGQDSPDYNILIQYNILFDECYSYFFRI